MKAGGIEKRVGIALFAAILVLGFIAQIAGSETRGVPKSALSKDADGRRAAYALLEDLGFEVEVWEQPPGALPRGPGLHWLPRVPVTLGMEHASQATVVDPEGRPLLGRLHDPVGYLRFMETGGALVVPVEEATEEFLTEQLGLGELEGFFAEVGTGPERRPTFLRSGEALDVEWATDEAFDEPAPVGGLERLLFDDAQRTLAFEIPVGRGRLVMLGDDSFLANEMIAVADHATLLVRLVEELAGGAPVRFDEYALGRWKPRSALGLATTARFGPITWHLFAVLLLFAWRHAWVREFPRDPEPLGAVSPLARARASASLYEHAERYERLANALVDGRLRQLAGRLRVPLPRAVDESVKARAEARSRLLGALARRSGLDGSAWHAGLLASEVRGAKDLARLEERLARFQSACENEHGERSETRES